jgi:hypothetical protein
MQLLRGLYIKWRPQYVKFSALDVQAILHYKLSGIKLEAMAAGTLRPILHKSVTNL